MGLTVVTSYFPLPQDRGDPVRVLMTLRAIATARPYTLLAVRRADTTDAQVEQLRGLLPGVEVRDFAATPYRLDRLGPLGRYPESLGDGLPPWVRTRYSRALHEALRTAEGEGVAIGEAAGAYFAGTRLRWHWDKANVLATSSREDIAEAPGVAHQLRARYLAGISARFEARALARCGTVSVTSDEEAARLRISHGRKADFTLPSCVPMPEGHEPAPRERELVWLSSFAYRSNLLGLRRFLDEAWEPLRGAGFTLSLVGSGLREPVREELSGYAGVRVLGYVEDLRPVLAGARAGIVPLWSGAGVKLKTLTLLAHSVPVFSTPVGAEGIPPSPAVRVAQTPAGIAEQVAAATAADLDGMAAAAPALVRERFSEQWFATRLLDCLGAYGYLGEGT